MQLTKQLSVRVKELMQEQRLSITALSEKSGVSRRTISRLLKAENVREVRIVTIMRLCRGFEISLTEFFDPAYFCGD